MFFIEFLQLFEAALPTVSLKHLIAFTVKCAFIQCFHNFKCFFSNLVIHKIVALSKHVLHLFHFRKYKQKKSLRLKHNEKYKDASFCTHSVINIVENC